MLVIKCAKCKAEIFKYQKIGKGRVLHCWKNRIVKDYSVHHHNKIECQCGNVIGVDAGRSIKMRRTSFTHTGTKIAK